MKQFRRVIGWLEEGDRAARWDALVQGNVAIIRSPILRGAARLWANLYQHARAGRRAAG